MNKQEVTEEITKAARAAYPNLTSEQAVADFMANHPDGRIYAERYENAEPGGVVSVNKAREAERGLEETIAKAKRGEVSERAAYAKMLDNARERGGPEAALKLANSRGFAKAVETAED